MSYKHPLDLSFIYKEIGESPDIVVEMCTVFAEVLREYQSAMDRAIENNDLDEIRLHAHKIKPSLTIFGLQDFLVLMTEVEKSARSNVGLDHISTLVSEIKDELPPIYEQLEIVIQQ